MRYMGKKNDISDRKKTLSSGGGFKIVDGGLRPPLHTRVWRGDFVMAEVSDTRLMGVIGLHVVRAAGGDTIHQFFYLDAEEYGVDEYTSAVNCSEEEVSMIKTSRFGALGGSWNEIGESEAAFLIKDFILFSQQMKLDLPEPKEEYLWYAGLYVSLSRAGYEGLWSKMCVPIRDDNELINYFLMRCTGMDYTGAARLASSEADLRFAGLEVPATLFRNSIKKTETPGRYICTMLIDDGRFLILNAGISVVKGKVAKAEKLSELLITPWEASLILRRDEYVVYNRYDGDRELFDRIMSLTFDTMTSQDYDIGTLYMIFNKNNDHVRDEVYRLDRDTMAAVLLVDNGELVVAGDDPGKTSFVENLLVLALGSFGQQIRTLGSYRFGEQVVGAFLDSEFFEFKDFLEFIQSFEEK